MVEGGDISGLVVFIEVLFVNNVFNLVEGLLVFVMSIIVSLSIDEGNDVFSIVVMMLLINDGFIGLDNWIIFEEVGIYILYFNVYDVGIEVNDEICGSGVSGEVGLLVFLLLEDLVGNNGIGVVVMIFNVNVYIYFGNIGDDEGMGGLSDVDNIV